MAKPDHQRVVDILKARDGKPTRVVFRNGTDCVVYNIAWGYDYGDDVAHITSNISPKPECEHTVVDFTADNVVEMLDIEFGFPVFSAGGK